MKRVLVLLSTYNGVSYVKEQLESVLGQTDVDVSLLIRDDGSKDNTVQLIESLYGNDSRLSVICGQNVGSAGSFMDLIHKAATMDARYDYYAFCDQDDVWLKDKLSAAVEALDNQASDKPSLYMGAYQMVDSTLHPIPTVLKKPTINLPAALAANSATGCTMVFNKALLDLLASQSPKDFIMHDYWAYLVCLSVGGYVYYDETTHILYRQHEHNVIGGRGDSFVKKWSVRLAKLFRPGDCFKSKLATELLRCYSSMMDDDSIKFLQAAATCGRFSSKMSLLGNPLFRGKTLDNDIQNFALVITGKF